MTLRGDSDQHSPIDASEASTPDANAELIGILDTVDVPIVVIGRNCTIVRFNRAASETLAFVPSDIGRRLSTIAALAGVADIEAICTHVIADEVPSRRDIRSGDRRFLLRVAPYVIDAGHIAGAVLTFTNMTAFRASLEQAIYEREYTKAILNTITTPLVVLDSELRVQSGNRAFYAMFGVSREQAQGLLLRNFGSDEWKMSALWTSLASMLADGHEFKPLEIERDFPIQGRRTILLDARRVPGQGAAAILLAVQDISERKRTEAELHDADRRKDEFLALLAHELRNPLAPIRTGLELIKISGDTPHSVRRVRSMMQRQVDQMVHLIDDLLDVSRIATGKIVVERIPTALGELVQSAVEAQRPTIEAAQIALTVDLPSEPCLVDADVTRFVQILSNVLHNAAKFTPAQGQIRCSVEIRRAADVPEVAITISDTGVGISQDMMPRIFEMFTQVESATQRSHGGLGIGLALARRLIEMHGGAISAHSDGLGHGSRFIITMPLCSALVAASLHSPPEEPRVTCRVLIIDDNEDAANVMSMLVEQLGGSACVAHNAANGLRSLEEIQPDIVLLDIGMPGTDGYEACRLMRQKPSQKHIVIVAVSGWGQAQDKQRALDAGFDAHLTKPVDPTALARVLAGASQRT